MKNILRYFLCGLAMGAADTVPGISGGTIAFITGIYEQLLNAIKSVNGAFFRYLLTGKFIKAFKLIPWHFILPLVAGIAIAIFSLANIVVYLLANHLTSLWAFFFGLIIASLLLLTAEFTRGKVNYIFTIPFFLLGILFAIWLTMYFTPLTINHNYPTIFFSGFIAICAMILPGISGAFILVLLGQYAFIMDAVSTLNVPILLIFAGGCLTGLICFAHILSTCLKLFYFTTLALLSGILAGSLVTVWPFTTQHIQNGINMELIQLIGLTILGIFVPFLLNKIARK